ncbi:SDR family NAD(P)-dependent oxidoreductase [Rhizorhabdus argentea]|uniref:SDR family NAD(P)-dependent oxidoreductase n=1 Tax=Rhizorhabdus argentea TaxID=1387174 RepID=UPI0030ECFE16
MAGRLEGRVAIITGAARGQGEVTARIFASEGAKVILGDVDDAEGKAAAAAIGGDAAYEHLDVTDEANWQAVIAAATQRWGGVDVLINNAGIVIPASIADMSKEHFLKVLEINLAGAWLGMKSVAPVMFAKGKGSIVNIVSTAGLWAMNGMAAYGASKWALRGLSRNAALEYGPRGVRVNAVFPGGINTRMSNLADEPVEDLDKYYVDQPIKRIGQSEEVARASLFLASDESSYMCGAELAVDGGQTLGKFLPFLPTS